MNDITNKNPMKLGNILDISINFFFKNILWITLLGIMTYLHYFFTSSLSEELNSSNFYETIWYRIAAIVVSFLLAPIVAATVSLNVADHYFERKRPWYQALIKSFNRFIPLLLLQLLKGLIIFIGGICFIIPGIIATYALSVSVPAMMIEDLEVTDSIRRSFDLTKGHRWRIFGYYLFYSLIITMVSAPLTLLWLIVPVPVLYSNIIDTVIFASLGSLITIICTLLYFDLRIRKEAMDIEEDVNTIDIEGAELT